MINFVFLIVIALCGAHASSLYVEPANRIAGGMNATDDQFPYMISLQKLSQVTNNTRGHKCGGALVTLRHAVTSASCLHEDRNGVLAVIDPKEYRVFAGATLLTNDTSEDRHRLVKNFIIHPNYSAPYENDIAIITLESEFPSNAVRTVPLAVTDPNIIQGLDCQSSGWGSQNHTSSVNIELMYTSKVVYNQTICQSIYSGIIPGIPQIPIGISKMCAMSTGISSSCAGDSGNPLVCSGTLNGILIVKAFNCSELGNFPQPEIYTRIASFHSWIRATSGAATFQPRTVVLALISIIQIVTAKMLN